MKNAAAKKAHQVHQHEGPADIDWSRVHVVGPRGAKAGRHYDLRTLRAALGKTQTDIADAADMEQGDVSKLEKRGDVKLSTLGRYAAALGGSVEVAVVIDGRRYLLDLVDDAGDPGETPRFTGKGRRSGTRRR
jgi:hypothetical protein